MKVIEQASFDHDCPTARVSIVKESQQPWIYAVDVCGHRRVYVDRGNFDEWQFVDETEPPKHDAAP